MGFFETGSWKVLSSHYRCWFLWTFLALDHRMGCCVLLIFFKTIKNYISKLFLKLYSKPVFLSEVVCCILHIYLCDLYRPWSISLFDNSVSLDFVHGSGPILRFLILFQLKYYNIKYLQYSVIRTAGFFWIRNKCLVSWLST